MLLVYTQITNMYINVCLKVASRPGSHNLRCLFRVAFVPRDACDLAQKDLNAFEYLYLQVNPMQPN